MAHAFDFKASEGELVELVGGALSLDLGGDASVWSSIARVLSLFEREPHNGTIATLESH